jgi:hypothetical protein
VQLRDPVARRPEDDGTHAPVVAQHVDQRGQLLAHRDEVRDVRDVLVSRRVAGGVTGARVDADGVALVARGEREDRLG